VVLEASVPAGVVLVELSFPELLVSPPQAARLNTMETAISAVTNLVHFFIFILLP
jgi:hypothetical protein